MKNYYLQILFVFFLINFSFHPTLLGQKNDTARAHQIIQSIDLSEFTVDYQPQIDKIESAAETFESAEQWGHLIEALTWQIRIFYEHDLRDKVLEKAEYAFKISSEKLGPEHPKTIYLYRYLAYGIEPTDVEEAIKKLEKGLVLSKKVNGPRHEATGDLHLELSGDLQVAGQLDNAFQNATQALEIVEQNYGKVSLKLAPVYWNLAVIQYTQGQVEESKNYLELGIKLLEQNEGKHLNLLADFYKMLGNVLDTMWDWRTGIEKYEKALEIADKVYGKNHVGRAEILTSYGYLHLRWSFFEEGEKVLLEALKILKNNSASDNPFLGEAYSTLGILYNASGQNEKAVVYLDSALITLKNPDVFPHLYESKANSYLYLKRFDEAITAINQSFKYLSVEYLENAPYDNPPKENIIKPIRALWSLYMKGLIYYKKWESEPENLSVLAYADQACQLGIELYNQIRKDYHLQQGYVNSLTHVSSLLHWQIIEINLAYFDQTKQSEYIDKAFITAERRKTLQLRSYRKVQKQEDFGVPKVLLEEGVKISNDLLECESQLIAAQKNKDLDEMAFLRNEELIRLREKQNAYFDTIRLKYPDYYNEVYNVSTTSPREIQQHLSDSEVFIDYSIHVWDSVIYAFIIDKDKETSYVKITVPGTDNGRKTVINERVSGFYSMLQGGNLVRADKRRKFIEASHELYNIFVQPLEKWLKEKDKIIFANDRLSNYLPFEVLLPSNEDKAYSDLDFLIKDYTISYHYTGGLFIASRKHKQNYEKELLTFAPVFSDENVAIIQDESFRNVIDTTYRSIGDGYFEPLYHSETEVENIHQLFLDKDLENCKVLTHHLANESALKSALAENYRIIHIATHSFANLTDTKFSGIACAQLEEEQGEDGILYLGEIQNVLINSDLIVLSSCESGYGKMLIGDGVLGLNRSFVYAGAPNVVFSLWKVFDQPTAQLMTFFYEAVLAGKTYPTALREAKLKMLAQAAMASPNFWGAFLLVGR